jgi:CRISPR/Cas system-associated exonuclease Cas4 (RecB family)
MEFTISGAMDAHIEQLETPRLPDGKWHPSSLYGCDRKALYEIRATVPSDERDPSSKRALRQGHIYHEFIQEAVANTAGLPVYDEVKIYSPDLNLTGSVDGVIMLSPDEAQVLEYKTTKAWGFKKLDGPKEDHIGQTKAYVYCLRKYGGIRRDGEVIPPLGDKLKSVRFAYICKDDFAIKEYVLQYDPSWDEEVESRVGALASFQETGKLPERLTGSGGKRNWLCGYCPFETRCWEVEED